MTKDRLKYLILGYITHSLQVEDLKELMEWRNSNPSNQSFLQQVGDDQAVIEDVVFRENIDTPKGYARWVDRRKKVRRRRIMVYAAAACLVAFAGLLFLGRPAGHKEIRPGRNFATITPAGNNTILATPNGAKYQVTLSDGTKVWVNNATRLVYPTTFVSGERTVELSGEAYFEVVADAAHPFTVKVKGTSIRALGTSFTIAAYRDEATIRITLISGKAQWQKDSIKKDLSPGEQVLSLDGGNSFDVKRVDTNGETGWKDGYFYIRIRSDLGTVLKQFERWYDVSVEYQDSALIREGVYVGYIGRDLPLQTVLKHLENENIHFTLSDHRLLVSRNR